MNKPVPYGIGPKYIIKQGTADALNIDRCLSDLVVQDFCEMKKVIDAYIERYEDSNTAETAWKHLTKSFMALSNKHQCAAVKQFSTALNEHYNCKKEKFLKEYKHALELLEEETDTQYEGNVVGMQVVRKGVQNYKRKLNKSMDKENKSQGSRKGPKRTTKDARDANTASQASTTLIAESTREPLVPATPDNIHISKTATLRIRIPTKALTPTSSSTTPTKAQNSKPSSSSPIATPVEASRLPIPPTTPTKAQNSEASTSSTSSSVTIPVESPNLPSPLPTPTKDHTPTASTLPRITIPVESPRVLSPATTPRRHHARSTSIDLNIIKETITAKAKSIHERFVEGEKIPLSDYKMMSSSLSSIIDLIDQNDDSQRQLFEAEQWELLNKYLLDMYKHPSYILPPTLKQTWQLISTFCQQTKSTAKSKSYLKKIIEAEEQKSSSECESVKILQVFGFVLVLYDENSWIFDEKAKKSEFDFVSIIWAPLIRKMIYIHNNIIQLKGGETINPYTQFMKEIQYDESKNVKGMKIDLRFVVTIGEEDKDLGCLEAANELPSNIKLHEDEGKLLVEAKDVVDGLVNKIYDIKHIHDIGGMAIQVAGLVGEIFEVYLHKKKLYVGVPEAKLKVPSNILSLDSFSNTFEALMTSIIEMEKLGVSVAKSHQFFKDRRLSLSRQYNRAAGIEPTIDYLAWLAPSWYPPTGNDGKQSRMHPVENDEVLPNSPPAFTEDGIEYDQTLVDEYGWVRLDSSKFYNVVMKTTLDIHPLAF